MSNIRQLLVAFMLCLIAACGGGGTLGNNGTPTTPVYKINLSISNTDGSAASRLSNMNPLRVSAKLTASGANVAAQLVTFSISDAGLASFSNQSATAQTSADGLAQIDLRVGSKSGAGSVTATLASGEKATITFDSAGDDASAEIVTLTLVVTDATGQVSTLVSKQNPLTVTAQLKSNQGKSQANKLIKFKLDNQNLATFSNQAATAATNEAGKATIQLIAGAISGSGRLTAELEATPAITQSQVFTSAGDGASVDVRPLGSVVFYADKLSLDSGSSDKIELTALVRDENNNFMKDVKVEFAGDNDAEIEVTSDVTTSNGVAKAILTTKANPAIRQLNLTASAKVGETKSARLKIDVTGTKIEVNAPQAVVLGSSTVLSFNVMDASGNGLANTQLSLSSALSNTFDQTNPVTGNTSGRANVTYTASSSGKDTIIVSALGITQSFNINVDTDSFGFMTDTAKTLEVPLNKAEPLKVSWLSNNSPVINKDVNLATTRGAIGLDAADLTNLRSAVMQKTDAQGTATVFIQSQFAGFANIAATSTGSAGAISALKQVEFVATTPDVTKGIEVQVFPTKVGPAEKSVVTAILRDSNNNPIKNFDVSFSLDNAAGGFINPAVARTNSLGIATTEFTADRTTPGSGTPAAVTGLLVKAQLINDALIKGDTTITVGKRTLFFRFGTGNEIEKVNQTLYKKQFAVIVTDSAGNPVSNQKLNLQIYPRLYRKGAWVKSPAAGSFVSWVPIYSTAEGEVTCKNEDMNRNGILDPGEDLNRNLELTPGNIAAVFGNNTDSATTVSDPEGVALFYLQYPREFAPWVVVDLVVSSGNVAGTENVTSRSYTLTVAGSDTTTESLPPPQNPFGMSTTNAEVELATEVVNGETRFVDRQQRCYL